MTEGDEASHLREQLRSAIAAAEAFRSESERLRIQLREAHHTAGLQRLRMNMLEVALEHYVYRPHEYSPTTGCVSCLAGKRLVDEGRELLAQRLAT